MRNFIRTVGGLSDINRPTGTLANRLTLILCLSLALSGCSANYNGERLLWKAQRLSAVVVKSFPNGTPEQYGRAIKAFQRVVDSVPGTVWAARAQVAIGSLYAMQKQFEQARGALRLVLQEYNRHQELCLQARYMIARSYELEERWEEAIAAYQELAEYHPWTKLGMEAPLYAGHLLKKHGAADDATKAFERAVRKYRDQVTDAPAPAASIQAKGMLALAYQQLEKWDEALAILEELNNLPSGTNRAMILFSLGSIHHAKFNNLSRASEYYAQLAKEFPETSFGKIAAARLRKIGEQGTEPRVSVPMELEQRPAIPGAATELLVPASPQPPTSAPAR